MLFPIIKFTTPCCFGAVAIDAVQPLLSLIPLSRIFKCIDFLDAFRSSKTLTRFSCSFPAVTVWPPLRGGATHHSFSCGPHHQQQHQLLLLTSPFRRFLPLKPHMSPSFHPVLATASSRMPLPNRSVDCRIFSHNRELKTNSRVPLMRPLPSKMFTQHELDLMGMVESIPS